MKNSFGVLIIALAVLCSNQGVAQHRPSREMDEPRPERLEKFRKMRLVEVLKLGEEDAVRFFAKQTAHEDTQRDFMKSRNEALNAIEDIVRDKKEGEKDIQKYADEVLSIDQKIFAERQRYQEDVRKLLTLEQFGKFLVFERNFGRQVKDALQEMREDRHERSRY